MQLLLTAPSNDIDPRGELLLRLLDQLDSAQIPYCVLHGYEDFPRHVASDVDCLMPRDALPSRLARELCAKNDALHGGAVQWLDGSAGHFSVLCARAGNSVAPAFLHLHVVSEIEVARHMVYSSEQILSARRRWHDRFWVPAVPIEFGSYLARRCAKGKLDAKHAQRLDTLYQQDPAGCRREAQVIWGRAAARWIESAGESGDWASLRLSRLRRAMLLRAVARHPARWVIRSVAAALSLARRWWRSDRGMTVALLGPDGSGKSSVVQAIEEDLSPVFAATQREKFPPRLLKRSHGKNSSPHAAPPRSFLASIVRAIGYWLIYYTAGHVLRIRPGLARARLILYDRHLLDALVDPRRYRYGGPMWLLRLIGWIIPKPDLAILLDAPPAVLQNRKQEVPPEETARQVEAYRKLFARMRTGHVIDADRPLPDVVADVEAVILNFLARRLQRRFVE